MRRPGIVAAVLLVAALVAPACSLMGDDRRSSSRRSRDAGDWTAIAERSIDFSREQETIEIASERRFRALRFEVKGGPVRIASMVVTFGDGSTFSPQLRSDFAEGTESRAIDLPGEGRRIQRIDLTCRSTSKREGRAVVRILAR
jgi:hypothetical protein